MEEKKKRVHRSFGFIVPDGEPDSPPPLVRAGNTLIFLSETFFFYHNDYIYIYIDIYIFVRLMFICVQC